jgi:hypothetical protein
MTRYHCLRNIVCKKDGSVPIKRREIEELFGCKRDPGKELAWQLNSARRSVTKIFVLDDVCQRIMRN